MATRGKGSVKLLLVLSAVVFSMAVSPACRAHLGNAQVNALGRKAQAGNTQALSDIRAAAEQGNPNAQVWLGAFYLHGRVVPKDDAKAYYWTRKAAEQGDGEAAYALGREYWNGIDVPRDPAKGIRWFKRAAHDGYAQAQALLGDWYLGGTIALPRNVSRGLMWLRKSAAQPHGDGLAAQDILAHVYDSGHGVAKDYAKAAKWYRAMAATTGGYPFPLLRLGQIYATGGWGLKANDVTAYQWMVLVEDNACPGFVPKDYAQARRTIAALSRDMQPAQIARARREASQWAARHHNATTESMARICARGHSPRTVGQARGKHAS